MNKRSLGALIALNVCLLVALVMVTFTPEKAKAQIGGSSYIMIAGQAVGQTNQNAVYIIETSTARMVSLMFNGGNKKIKIIAGRKLSDDFRGTTRTDLDPFQVSRR